MQLVIVGAGLAGLTAAITAVHLAVQQQVDLHVIIVDKNQRPGGNSMRASSGISALTPSTGDTTEQYEQDTLASGKGLSDQMLVHALVEGSQEAIEFLEGLGVNLSKLSRLGGHSTTRTHSNPTGPNVGFAIMKAALTAAEKLPGVKILTSTKVDSILYDQGRVVGVKATSPETGSTTLPADAVVVATGGYAANKSLLERVCPRAAACATTNGPWATGDAIEFCTSIGADVIQLDQVQVHPTGFVDPADPDSPSKILAAERLRGVGGILLDPSGHRFVDELQLRDHVTAAINRLPGHSAHLLLSQQAAEEFGAGAIAFYCSKGLMTQVDGVEGAAEALGVEVEVLRAELEGYNRACEAGGDEFGKAVFPCKINLQGVLHVGLVTPVVHYTMGGLAVSERGEVLSAEGHAPIPGLFAAGEVAGGLHGANRLAGNSLLECVVFGRIVAESAVSYAVRRASST